MEIRGQEHISSEHHIQFPIVEYHSQLKALLVAVSLAFILSSLILLFSTSAFPFDTTSGLVLNGRRYSVIH